MGISNYETLTYLIGFFINVGKHQVQDLGIKMNIYRSLIIYITNTSVRHFFFTVTYLHYPKYINCGCFELVFLMLFI